MFSDSEIEQDEIEVIDKKRKKSSYFQDSLAALSSGPKASTGLNQYGFAPSDRNSAINRMMASAVTERTSMINSNKKRPTPPRHTLKDKTVKNKNDGRGSTRSTKKPVSYAEHSDTVSNDSEDSDVNSVDSKESLSDEEEEKIVVSERSGRVRQAPDRLSAAQLQASVYKKSTLSTKTKNDNKKSKNKKRLTVNLNDSGDSDGAGSSQDDKDSDSASDTSSRSDARNNK